MLKSNNTKTKLEVLNSISLQDAKDLAEKGKGQHFVSRFIEPGIAEYKGSFGKILITKETLDKFIRTIIGVPVIIKHKDIDSSNVDKERVGVVSEVWYDSNDGWYYCSGVLFDSQAIDLVKNQGWSVSCTYDFETDNKKGTYHGLDYDMQFTNGEFLHLALVPNPRYEEANIVMNSKAENDDKWITIGADENRTGRHILVKDGQTKEEAIKEFWDDVKDKNKQQEIIHKSKFENDEDLKIYSRFMSDAYKPFDSSEKEYIEYLKDNNITSFKEHKKLMHSGSIPGAIKHFGEWRIKKLKSSQPKKEDTSSKEGEDIIQKYITRSEWEKERNAENSLDSIINNALKEVIIENCLGEF